MAAAPSSTQADGVQSVDRALRILEALGSEHTGLRLSEVAARVTLAPSTAHRLLTTMEQRRFVHYADLQATRARGYAIDREEHLLGLHCVAAPIFDGTGDAVAALSVSALAGRASAERDAELGRLVAASASEVTDSIGGIRPSGWAEQREGI